MGIALVSAGPLTGSLSPTFGQATAAGNLLVAWVSTNDGSAVNPIGTAAPGWVQAGPSGSSFDWADIWYKPNCGAGEAAPVFTSPGASNARTMLAEFSGAKTSSPLDSKGAGSGFSAVTASNGAADAQAGDLIAWNATWTGNGTATTITTSMTDGTGAAVTVHESKDAGANTPQINVSFSWGIAGAAGASPDSATSTLGQFSASRAFLVSFLAAGGAGGAAPDRHHHRAPAGRPGQHRPGGRGGHR